MKPLALFLLILLSSCCKEEIEDCPCYKADQQGPVYKGCETGVIYDENNNCALNGMYSQLYSELVYPPKAREDSIQGTIAIAFDVYTDGSIGNYSVAFDTLGYGLADAAIEAIKTLNGKGFCPARENCIPVIFRFTLPILFTLG